MTTVHTSPELRRQPRVNHLRLVGALAGKDIVDALKNKTTLTTIIISLFMVLVYRALPGLTSDSDTLRVMLYAESETPEHLGADPVTASPEHTSCCMPCK